jgi:hypothetical protein
LGVVVVVLIVAPVVVVVPAVLVSAKEQISEHLSKAQDPSTAKDLDSVPASQSHS